MYSVDAARSLARFCIILGKKLYLRRSQNNAYNHDGLVQTQTLSLETFFYSFLSLSLSLRLFTTYTLDIKSCHAHSHHYFLIIQLFMKICNVALKSITNLQLIMNLCVTCLNICVLCACQLILIN